MAKVTLVFAVLLVALGLAGYLGTGSLHPTALIPTWFGVALLAFGLLAMSPNESRRKLFMHINVTIGLLGFIGGAVEAIRGYVHAQAVGTEANPVALASKVIMAGLLLIYVILCVRSFIAARRSGKV
jgi:nitrate/nitrite transporter NarK